MSSEFKIDWIKKYLKNYPKAIMEIGSYDGKDSIRFKKSFNKSRVICIEADKYNYEKFVLPNIKNSNLKIESANLAMSDKNDKIKFYRSKKASGSIYEPTLDLRTREPYLFSENLEIVEVVSMTLDTYCSTYNIDFIDFIHMDVQGAEYSVMQGLTKFKPYMIFAEIHAFNLYETGIDYNIFHNHMIKLGYKVVEKTSADNLYIRNN